MYEANLTMKGRLEIWLLNKSPDKVMAQPSRRSQLMPVKMKTMPSVMDVKYIASFVVVFFIMV